MSVEFINTELPDAIELQNVNQTYDKGKTWTIKDLNLLIEIPERNKFICILGKSGCGKSTILRYISGLQTPTSGKILIKGKERTEHDRVGMVFQKYSSFPWYTVEENVELGLKFKNIKSNERKAKVKDILNVVGLKGHEHKFAAYPQLSGGQLQRVAIARSLISNPEILLLDEPFGALDILTKLAMQEFLVEMWEKFKNTVVMVTHDISEACFLADEIWLMKANPGEIVDRIIISDHLPYERTKELKRTKKFTDLVYNIEDRMVKL
jgi:NitT/TauT family transport system ATP-binding protein